MLAAVERVSSREDIMRSASLVKVRGRDVDEFVFKWLQLDSAGA